MDDKQSEPVDSQFGLLTATWGLYGVDETVDFMGIVVHRSKEIKAAMRFIKSYGLDTIAIVDGLLPPERGECGHWLLNVANDPQKCKNYRRPPMRDAEINLGYFKQGDDMNHCLEECGGQVTAALRLRADGLEETVKHLRDIATAIADTGKASEFTIEADTHFIGITGPDELIDDLIKRDLLDEPYMEDEEEDDEEAFEDDWEEDEEFDGVEGETGDGNRDGPPTD